MTLPDRRLLCVRERDIDLLLLEEAVVSPEFRDFLIRAAGLDPECGQEFLDGWHSMSHSTLGESDLVFLWRGADGTKTTLLVEDKIDAPAQPNQARRYRIRGQAGVEEGDWDAFKTCIIAPARYLGGNGEASAYDAQISYEDVTAWFSNRADEDRRAIFKREMLSAAIEQQRRGYSPIIDETVSEFWWRFWERSREVAPRLGLPEPSGKPSGATWIACNPPELRGIGRIIFKLPFGVVDLQLDSEVAGNLNPETDLPDDLELVSTGNSKSLRTEVDPLDASAEFVSQSASVDEALRAAIRLMDLWKCEVGAIPEPTLR